MRDTRGGGGRHGSMMRLLAQNKENVFERTRLKPETIALRPERILSIEKTLKPTRVCVCRAQSHSSINHLRFKVHHRRYRGNDAVPLRHEVPRAQFG